jgi:hypothetical protein
MTEELTKAASLAFGFLWRVEGDASKDDNIRFAYSARAALRAILTTKEQRAGIWAARKSKVSWEEPT